MSIVVCRLPKAGLGNHLYPLMNALVFGKLNNLPVIVIGYHQLKIGPYLRKEKIKRKYNGYFTFQKNIIGETLDKVRVYILTKLFEINKEPPVEKIAGKVPSKKIYLFEKLPTYHNYFIHLKGHRQLVKELLYSVINPAILAEVEKSPKPLIGLHIRMGDFRKLKQGEDFSKVGHVRTPEYYFIEIVNAIRKIYGENLPVSLFTDGYRHEFEEIFSLDKVTMIEGNADIVDLLLLSRSSILIAANGSTFSYWAGFLADAPLIKHPDHLHAPFRPDEVNHHFYEGPMLQDAIDPLLIKNIRSIISQQPNTGMNTLNKILNN
jgi:hypothetical protein